MRFVLSVACALSGAVLAAGVRDGAPAGPAPAKVAALDKIAVIGASFSAGYGMDKNPDPFAESKLHLAHVIEASLLAPHQAIDDFSTAMFFLDPQGTAKRTLKKLNAGKPSSIVAIDYLFWFAYGDKDLGPDGAKADPAAVEAKRIAELDAGLKELGAFTCPILLGDLPDMSLATLVERPMITKSMVPAPATLATMNEHIRTFAKEHPNVVVVPLADVTAKLQGDLEIKIRGNTWPKGSIGRLMQADRLHTTVEGTSAVWIVAADAWLNAQKDVPASAFELDAAKVAAKVAETAKNAPPVEKPAKKTRKKVGAGS